MVIPDRKFYRTAPTLQNTSGNAMHYRRGSTTGRTCGTTWNCLPGLKRFTGRKPVSGGTTAPANARRPVFTDKSFIVSFYLPERTSLLSELLEDQQSEHNGKASNFES